MGIIILAFCIMVLIALGVTLGGPLIDRMKRRYWKIDEKAADAAIRALHKEQGDVRHD